MRPPTFNNVILSSLTGVSKPLFIGTGTGTTFFVGHMIMKSTILTTI
jgi:hypothetical protein